MLQYQMQGLIAEALFFAAVVSTLFFFLIGWRIMMSTLPMSGEEEWWRVAHAFVWICVALSCAFGALDDRAAYNAAFSTYHFLHLHRWIFLVGMGLLMAFGVLGLRRKSLTILIFTLSLFGAIPLGASFGLVWVHDHIAPGQPAHVEL